uniref:Profilin n=1 Tax=Eptatretus burgeri TaxID=7764 RepID=A0A8C4Q900_EPTBU
MSWDAYISTLIADGTVNDAVIYGLKTRCVWASKPGGDFKSISVRATEVPLAGLTRRGCVVGGVTKGVCIRAFDTFPSSMRHHQVLCVVSACRPDIRFISLGFPLKPLSVVP